MSSEGGQRVGAAADASSTDPRLPDKARVLLANEPRAYRETIAAVIEQMREDVEVETAVPVALDDAVRRSRPRMVICSEATETVRSEVPVWVELYPGHGSRSLASIEGRREEYEDIQLSDLLDILDRALGPTG
jgi:hypothetical protein